MQKVLSILVTEDDPLVRMVLVVALKTLKGINILEAQNGQEALKILGLRNYNVAVLVTDHDMPVMTGDILISEAKKIAPEMKTLMISGRCTQEYVDQMRGPSRPDEFLAKPFRPATILDMVIKLCEKYIVGE